MRFFLKRLAIAVLVVNCLAGPVLAISENDKQAVLNDTVFYDENDQCLAGGPGGSGPLFGLHFPKISDTADLAKRINDYIKQVSPRSPLNGYGDTFVKLGQKYDVNPAYIVGDAQNESSLGTTGQETTHNYFGINQTAGYPSQGRYAIFPDVATGLEVYFKLLGGPGYLGPPSNFTQVDQVTRKTTPWGDGNNNPEAKAAQIIDVMRKILTGISIDSSQSPSASVNEAPASSCGALTTSAGALGWDISGPHAMVTYLQTDPRWGSKPYGEGKSSIGESGCGPTSIAMVLATLLHNPQITPLSIANQYGGQYHTDGTAWGIFQSVAKDYKINVQQYGPDLAQAAATLRKGGLVVGTFAPGYFTSVGHFMVIRAVSPDGNSFYIADPINASHNTVAYTTSFLISTGQLKQIWTFNP